MRKKLDIVIVIALLLISGSICFGQVRVKVITKTVEQNFEYAPENTIVIRGEKSQIDIKGWDSNQVKVQLTLICKAKSEQVAAKESKYQKYILEKKKDEIRLANYYQVPTKTSLESVLLAKYEIWVPSYAKLEIHNSYGNINLTNLGGNLTLTNKFGNISLDQISGLGEYQCYFGDFTAHNLKGNNRLKFNKTKTTIKGLSGILNLDSNLGDVTIGEVTGLVKIDIKGSKSDINLELNQPWKQLNLQLRSEFGDILISEQITASTQKTGNVSSLVRKGNGQSKIKVETNFGMINLTAR